MKNPQTTIALTFWTHIISGIDGVMGYGVESFRLSSFCLRESKLVRFLGKAELTLRTLLYFANRPDAEKIGHDFRKGNIGKWELKK